MTGATLDRRSLLCEQAQPPKLTGIDFIAVVDPSVQTDLLVYFIIEPDEVVTGPGPTHLADGPYPKPFGAAVTLEEMGGGGSATAPALLKAEFVSAPISGENRTALHLQFDRPGDFSFYRLTIDNSHIDPFFNGVLFSFKQGCDTGFDCRDRPACPPDALRDVAIDYLARDFASFNRALDDFAARYYPEWGERIPPDVGVMITELFAALGDEFSYIQDRFALECYLETASQRRSLMRLARLVDYLPDPGRNASCLLALQMKPTGVALAETLSFTDRLRFWAVPEGRLPVPFELGTSLADDGEILVHSSWNAMPLYEPDAGEPCLPAGATSLLLAPAPGNLALPLDTQIPNPGPWLGQAWVGRTMILWSRPADPGVPVRAWPITITGVDTKAVDPLVLNGGNPTALTRISWDRSQALPNAVRIAETVLLGNVAAAVAGRTVIENFRVGPLADATMAGTDNWPQAVEREGAANAECARDVVILYGLAASESQGVNHVGEHDLMSSRMPEIRLEEKAPDAVTWTYQPSLLEAEAGDRIFTLDPGVWRPIVRYQRLGLTIVHQDYASDNGYTLRFGGGEFGRSPDLGSAFKVTYRTAVGTSSNLGPSTITVIDPPDGTPRANQLMNVDKVLNPLPASGGVDPETDEQVRQNAPEYFRGYPMNAVRDEHFKQIVEREDWVQKAGSVTRWTGSWLRHFVTADPLDSEAYTPAEREDLKDVVNAIRMAGRDVVVRDPLYASLDLEISFCVKPGFYDGQVREAVLNALAAPAVLSRTRFFDPDSFTFGQSLRRASIEAAVQAVPGVLGVTGICVRRRGTADCSLFSEPEIKVAANEIIRVDNDPNHPEHGSIRVRVSGDVQLDTGCACCTP